ncbi:hypothetical protein RJT34_31879 [Clitoria ternatea]|uniref:Uncharacterized protein n=1 Tax=Clitoria ternatea TaxID=43366 RepID=A0AAN9EV09_CLITE
MMKWNKEYEQLEELNDGISFKHKRKAQGPGTIVSNTQGKKRIDQYIEPACLENKTTSERKKKRKAPKPPNHNLIRLIQSERENPKQGAIGGGTELIPAARSFCLAPRSFTGPGEGRATSFSLGS